MPAHYSTVMEGAQVMEREEGYPKLGEPRTQAGHEQSSVNCRAQPMISARPEIPASLVWVPRTHTRDECERIQQATAIRRQEAFLNAS